MTVLLTITAIYVLGYLFVLYLAMTKLMIPKFWQKLVVSGVLVLAYPFLLGLAFYEYLAWDVFGKL